MADSKQQFQGEQSLSEDSIHVSLTYDPLDSTAAMARVKSPKAGAVVLFAGTLITLQAIPSYSLTCVG